MKRIVSVVAALALWIPVLAFSAASISEAKLGKAIVDREISGETNTFALDETAYLWMRVVDGSGETITVIWANGDQTYEVQLNIGSNAWRTWSSKVLHIPGQWTVKVNDSAGAMLYQSNLTVQ